MYTDHKPLVPMLNNPKKNSPFPVERIRLKLQGFKFTVKYLPGSKNPADYNSKHPTAKITDDTDISEELNEYVNEIIKDRITRIC